MPRRPEIMLPPPDSAEKEFANQHFIDEQMDGNEYQSFTFSFCTFEKIGMKGAIFRQCTFRHCEFIDCYFAHAEFEYCKMTGSFFDRCVFSWAKFPNTGLDYTNFSNCGPVLSQIRDQKPAAPQSAAKLFRNLAAEHKKLGNWEEVDKYAIQAYQERERHFWYVVSRHNEHYRSKYNSSQRATYALRLMGYKLAGLLLGYGISWRIFGRTIIIFGVIIFPVLNAIFGDYSPTPFQWRAATGDELRQYLSELYAVTTRSFMPFVPSGSTEQAGIEIPFILSSIEAIFGTTMMAVFAALLFRWASKGN